MRHFWQLSLLQNTTAHAAMQSQQSQLAADMTLLIYEHHGGVVRTVAWSPDGAHIATGGEDVTVRLWNVLNGQTKLTYHGHSSSVNMIAWSPNGRLIASGCIDRTVQIWEVASGKLLHSHECQYTWANVAWSPNSQLIASTSNDGIRSGKAIYDTMIQVWEAISGKNVTNYRGHTALINAVAWSPDGQRVASGGADNSVQMWEVTTGKLLCRYEDDSSAVNVITWSSNSLRVALGKCDGTVQIWTITTGKLIYCHKEDTLENIPVLSIGIPLSVQAIVWSPDSQLIASAHSGNSVEIGMA